MSTKLYWTLLIFTFVLAGILRFYKLGQIPLGLYQDETAIGYNAYSLLKTAKDEHGQFLPIYFKSFGDYKLPVYIYLTTIPIKLFGLNEFAVRFPSALFGFFTVIAFYFLVKEITRDKTLAMISTGFLAINPWHLHYSRATFEVSISLFLFTLGGLLLSKAFSHKNKGAFLFGTLCFVANIYAYNLTRLLSPLMFGLFVVFYNFHNFQKRSMQSQATREFILTFIISAFLLIPFIVTLFGSGGIVSTGGTLIFSSAQIQAPLLEFRSYLINLPTILAKAFFNMQFLTIWQYIENIASYLSVPFFFISGSSHGNHGIGNVGEFYLFELPLMAIGIIASVRKKTSWSRLLIFWAILVILVASLTREAPHATRSFFLTVPLEVFSALGLILFWLWVKIIKAQAVRRLILCLVVGIAFYNILYYFISYYVRFPIAYAKAWRLEDKALSLYLKQNQHKYSKIIFDDKAGFIYTSFLFYSAYPPFEFQKSVVRTADDSEGFSSVVSFGKLEFKSIDWSKDYIKGTLIITTEKEKPENTPEVARFYYPRRPVVISLKQKIIQYPVDEVAYVLVEK